MIDLPPGGRHARFWGQIRPGTGVRTVSVLRLRPGQKVFRVLADLQTDATRLLEPRTLPVERPAKYRFSWEQAAVTAGGLPTRRLSGVVELAGDPARQWHASRP